MIKWTDVKDANVNVKKPPEESWKKYLPLAIFLALLGSVGLVAMKGGERS